jgi:adenine-specific DNA-methyltransferase
MPDALRATVAAVDCSLLVLSYNDEAWVGVDQLEAMCAHHDEVVTLSFDSARYVGARVGIYDPAGRKVGSVSHVRNREYLVVAGEPADVHRAVEAARSSPVVPAGCRSR